MKCRYPGRITNSLLDDKEPVGIRSTSSRHFLDGLGLWLKGDYASTEDQKDFSFRTDMRAYVEAQLAGSNERAVESQIASEASSVRWIKRTVNSASWAIKPC